MGPGETARLVLARLEPGSYAAVSYVEEPDGGVRVEAALLTVR